MGFPTITVQIFLVAIVIVAFTYTFTTQQKMYNVQSESYAQFDENYKRHGKLVITNISYQVSPPRSDIFVQFNNSYTLETTDIRLYMNGQLFTPIVTDPYGKSSSMTFSAT